MNIGLFTMYSGLNVHSWRQLILYVNCTLSDLFCSSSDLALFTYHMSHKKCCLNKCHIKFLVEAFVQSYIIQLNSDHSVIGCALKILHGDTSDWPQQGSIAMVMLMSLLNTDPSGLSGTCSLPPPSAQFSSTVCPVQQQQPLRCEKIQPAGFPCSRRMCFRVCGHHKLTNYIALMGQRPSTALAFQNQNEKWQKKSNVKNLFSQQCVFGIT